MRRETAGWWRGRGSGGGARLRLVDRREAGAANLLQLDCGAGGVAARPGEEEGGDAASVLAIAREALGRVPADNGPRGRSGTASWGRRRGEAARCASALTGSGRGGGGKSDRERERGGGGKSGRPY